jgi:amino acid transporter
MLLLSILAISNFEAVAGAPAPLTFLLQDVLGKVPGKTFEVCAVLSLVVNMMILQLTAARVIWSQARDGQMPFPRLMTKLTADQVPLTAVIVASLIAIGFCLWTGLLTVLISMTAILWAAGYAVLVGVLMWGKSRNALPHARPFTNGRWSPLVDSVALIWSVGLCVILIKQNPSDVGWGFLVTIVVGLLLYFVLIPPGRRGVIKDVRDEPDAALVAETS